LQYPFQPGQLAAYWPASAAEEHDEAAVGAGAGAVLLSSQHVLAQLVAMNWVKFFVASVQ